MNVDTTKDLIHIKIDADFQRDLRNELRSILRDNGYDIADSEEVDAVCITYGNLLFRTIRRVPREVLRSTELRESELPSDIAAAIDGIEAIAEAGGDLNRYVSTLVREPHQPYFHDPLFNEWRVHHLHLDLPSGRPAKYPGFARRSDEMLFVFVTETKVLFIDFGKHGEWADKRLVEILHSNWPDEIAYARAPNVVAASVHDHAWARSCGLSILTVTADGTVYNSLGGGYTKGRPGKPGISMQVRFWVNRLRTDAQRLEDRCRTNLSGIVEDLKRRGYSARSVLRLRLRIADTGGLHVVHEESGTRVDHRFAEDGLIEAGH